MNYIDIRNAIEQMAQENYEEFVKALIGFEKGIMDMDALEKLYTDYMDNDSINLLNDAFDDMINSLHEKEALPEMQLNKWQKAFEEILGNSFCIYQIRDSAAELRFMGMNYLEEHGLSPSLENYEAVYASDLHMDGKLYSPKEMLDKLYMTFNINRPNDFTGHSLSVSDIVTLKLEGVSTSYYVDSVGFVLVPNFLESEILPSPEKEDDGRSEASLSSFNKEVKQDK